MTGWIEQTPALAPYRFPILDAYRQQAHVLDDKGERLLSLASQFNHTPATTYQELSTSDIKFPTLRLADGKDVVLSPGNYAALLEGNRDQGERGRAAAAYLGTYGATANTYAAIYNAHPAARLVHRPGAQLPTTLDAALDGNAIPRAVVETLVDATRAGRRRSSATRGCARSCSVCRAITRTTRSCRSTRARSAIRSRKRAISPWRR